MYYLQSRYYNPTWGRFINADTFVSTGQGLLGNNMFAYCRNNPVKRADACGTDDICVTDEDDNIFNDPGGVYRGSGGGAGGGSNAGGGTTGSAAGSSTGGASRGYNPDQQAVIDLAKEHRNSQLTYTEAEILTGYAREYGVKYHEPMIHLGRGGYWSGILHIKIHNIHIAVCGGV